MLKCIDRTDDGPLRAETCRSDIVLMKWCFNNVCGQSSVFTLKRPFQLLVNYTTWFGNSVLSGISGLKEQEVREE
jgi:hypothetical protein